MEETSAAAQRTREVSAHTLYDLPARLLLSGDGGWFFDIRLLLQGGMLTDSECCRGFRLADGVSSFLSTLFRHRSVVGDNLADFMLLDAFPLDTLDECIGRRDVLSLPCAYVGMFSLALEIHWLPRGGMVAFTAD